MPGGVRMEKMVEGRTQMRVFAMLLLEIGMEIMYFLSKKKNTNRMLQIGK